MGPTNNKYFFWQGIGYFIEDLIFLNKFLLDFKNLKTSFQHSLSLKLY